MIMWRMKLATLCACHGITYLKHTYEFHGHYMSSLHYFSVSDLKDSTTCDVGRWYCL